MRWLSDKPSHKNNKKEAKGQRQKAFVMGWFFLSFFKSMSIFCLSVHFIGIYLCCPLLVRALRRGGELAGAAGVGAGAAAGSGGVVVFLPFSFVAVGGGGGEGEEEEAEAGVALAFVFVLVVVVVVVVVEGCVFSFVACDFLPRPFLGSAFGSCGGVSSSSSSSSPPPPS